MYRKILVGVAFHNSAPDKRVDQVREAIKVANLLRDDGGTVILLHVVEDIQGYIGAELPVGIIEKSRDNAEDMLRELAESSSENLQTAVVYGHSGRSIVDYAGTHDIDCIVVISHQPELTDYLLGTTAAHVARHAPCAVHILR